MNEYDAFMPHIQERDERIKAYEDRLLKNERVFNDRYKEIADLQRQLKERDEKIEELERALLIESQRNSQHILNQP